MEIRDEVQLAQLQAVVNAHCSNCETFKKSLMWAIGLAVIIHMGSFGYLIRKIDFTTDMVGSLNQKVDYLERSGLVERQNIASQVGQITASMIERRGEVNKRMDDMSRKLDEMHNEMRAIPRR